MNNLFICNYFLHPVKLQMRIVSPSPKGKKEESGSQNVCAFTKLSLDVLHSDKNYAVIY